MRKWISVLMSVCILCTIISGCGQNSNSNSDENYGKDETNASDTLESGDIHLTVWAGEEDKDLIATIADNFIKEHAGEANITIDWVSMEEGECRSALLGDVLNGPDVYTTTDGDIRIIASGGAADPVKNQEQVAANNLDAAVESMTVNGTIYGYPITADNGSFLYYNKAYFSDEDIKSLDTMLEKAAGAGKKLAMDWTSGWYLYSFFGETGLSVGLNDDGVTNYCDWNSTDKTITGADVVKAMAGIGTHPGFASMSQDEWIAEIKSGTVIACVSGIWDEKAIKEAWGDNFGAARLPEYKCGEQNVQMSSFFGYKLVGVNPYSEHLEWAQEFAQYIANAENQKLRFEMRGQVPANLEAAKDPEIQSSIAIQALLEQSEYSELQRIGGNYWGAMTTLGTTLALGNPNNIDYQELIDNAVKQITSSTVQ